MAAGSERRMALRLLLAFLIEAAVCPYGLNVSSKPTDGGRPPKMRRVGLVAVVAAASVTAWLLLQLPPSQEVLCESACRVRQQCSANQFILQRAEESPSPCAPSAKCRPPPPPPHLQTQAQAAAVRMMMLTKLWTSRETCLETTMACRRMRKCHPSTRPPPKRGRTRSFQRA